ncbi:MAG: T9SS type A sorting domain-containing protein, partial [Balneolaceae bacterium]|nr:T9SS type A sorting domain-containing protein [Balneolaceae bacterium]
VDDMGAENFLFQNANIYTDDEQVANVTPPEYFSGTAYGFIEENGDTASIIEEPVTFASLESATFNLSYDDSHESYSSSSHSGLPLGDLNWHWKEFSFEDYEPEPEPGAEIEFANLQHPQTGEISEGDEFIVYSRVQAEGFTDNGESDDIQAWIGVNTEDVAPSEDGWTWIASDFNDGYEGDGHEYQTDIGSELEPGEYYYASRFQLEESDYVYGGFEGGFWDGENNVSGQLTVNAATDVEEMADIPEEFGIDQNYPNPFNPSSNIRYAVPQTSHVTIEVYNVTGQLVATLVNETRNAGYHNVTFDGTRLASGLYIYRMQAGNFVQIKKMMMIK